MTKEAGLILAVFAAISIAVGITILFQRDEENRYSKKLEIAIIAATFIFALVTGLFWAFRYLFPDMGNLWGTLSVVMEVFTVAGIMTIVFRKFGIVFPW